MRVRRWLLLLIVAGAGGLAAARLAQSRRSALATPPSPIRPFVATAPPTAQRASTAPSASSTGSNTAPSTGSTPAAKRWVPSKDGACPPGYPIKANDSSKICHAPGGRFYERTIPERCYANLADAVADGYRAAKA